MREIGGYIELDDIEGEEYHDKAIALNSGRHCLEYLIKAKNIKKLYIPYFLCACIKETCEKCNCEYEYYHIDQNFDIEFDKVLLNNEYIYIVNYYGQIQDKDIFEYKDKYKNIVIDNSQAFFNKPIEGIDTLYTCRKFFGVSDGGYLYTNANLREDIQIDKSYERIRYVLGRYETNATMFYKESVDNNECFANEELKYMSKLTHNILKRIDYSKVASTRNENFEYLHSKLSNINKLRLNIPHGAFMYPLYLEKGSELKKSLIKNKIFIPTLWPNICSNFEKELAENIVAIPVDQRYSIEDMKYITKQIFKLI